MSVKQLSVFAENKPGKLHAMTGVLSENGIDLRAFSLAESTEFGVLRAIVDDTTKAAQVLGQSGFIYSVTPVLAVEIPDVPGGLNQVLVTLKDAQVNVEYMYAFLGGKAGSAYMVFRVEDNDVATAALEKAGIQLATQESLGSL